MPKLKLSILLFAFAIFLPLSGVFAVSEEEGNLGGQTLNAGLPPGTLVVSPTASVVSGTYTSSQSVTLTAPGSNSILYTLTGTAPACPSTGTSYTGAISITSSKTLQAIACYVSDNSVSSVVSTYTYTIRASTPSGGGLTMPVTTNGQVTATVAAGGKTTLTTADNTTAQVELPANAVTASTNVKISAESKTNVIVSRPIPSGKTAVGNYVYNYTATAAGKTVSTFLKEVTITITYTGAQITGLNENSLKIYYWNSTQWLALTSTVDKTNKKVTANTTHFTYFIVMGELETPSERVKPEDYGLKEGNLIRAEGDLDIFIINQYGYKRLFLNPAIFNMYGHFGSWKDVITVTPTVRDAFITSTHYRYVDSSKVYHLEVTGEDTGMLHWINMTAANFSAQGGVANAIFTINKSELDWYPKGADKTSL